LVPAIRTDSGDVLTENAAVLQYIAEQFPDAELAPTSGLQRARLQQWLCFIGTELHKATFIPLFDKSTPEAVRSKTLDKGAARLAYLDTYLAGREFLLDRFTVADAYLFTVLNWAQAVSLDLKAWPNVMAYYKHMRLRPSIARAFREELTLYQAEQKRHQAA
jgi:glutathione S-transferase